LLYSNSKCLTVSLFSQEYPARAWCFYESIASSLLGGTLLYPTPTPKTFASLEDSTLFEISRIITEVEMLFKEDFVEEAVEHELLAGAS
jgi:hypothetical protein